MEKRRHFWLKVIWFLGHFVLPAVISFNKVFPLPLSCSPPPICVLHACKCVYACVHKHSCGDQNRMLGVILCRFYCITVRWGLLSFWWTGWLARSLDPSVFAPWYGRGPGVHRYAQLFTRVPGIWALRFAERALCPTEPSSQPHGFLWYVMPQSWCVPLSMYTYRLLKCIQVNNTVLVCKFWPASVISNALVHFDPF